jgi:ADP-ribose pyrophosphatase YjhB (NUDIX family)
MEVVTLGEAKIYFSQSPLPVLNELKISNAYIVNQAWSLTGERLLNDIASGCYQVAIVNGDPAMRIAEINRSVRCIKAGGGVVLNELGEVLMIFRNGVWDLPKGKWDEGETISECALLEDEEETGITHIQLGSFLATTRHFYADHQGWVLKETYWYRMQAPNQTLVPQKEEGISEVCWVDQFDLHKHLLNTYYSIKQVLQTAALI